MSFGLSAGDIFLGIKLIKDTLEAFSTTRGSQRQYADIVQQLHTLETCLRIAQHKLADLNVDDTRSLVGQAVAECSACIDTYQQEILNRYERFFGNETKDSSKKRFMRELKKIQWLHEKEKTEALSKAIATHVQIITLACSIESLQSSSHVPNDLRLPLPSAELQNSISLYGKERPDDNDDDIEILGDASLDGGSKPPDTASLLNADTLLSRIPEIAESYSEPASATSINSTSPATSSAISSINQKHASITRRSATSDYSDSLFRSTTSVTTPSPSIFSRRPSLAPSASATTVSTTTTLAAASMVDEHGACQIPSCQRRTYLQKKSFALYARLTYRGGGQALSLKGESGLRPTCEHTLLYLQSRDGGVGGVVDVP
jgi:hypothetical protein